MGRSFGAAPVQKKLPLLEGDECEDQVIECSKYENKTVPKYQNDKRERNQMLT